MTPKGVVQAKYPDAFCYGRNKLWLISNDAIEELGEGDSPEEAWADAAARLERNNREG